MTEKQHRYDLWCSSDSSRCPEFRDILKYDIGQKWLRYWQKTYAHIWAYGPNLILNDPRIGQIWIIFYETNFPPYLQQICIFSVIYSFKSLKMFNSGPKNLQKNTKSSISQFAILLQRESLKIYLLLHFSSNRLEIFRSCS